MGKTTRLDFGASIITSVYFEIFGDVIKYFPGTCGILLLDSSNHS